MMSPKYIIPWNGKLYEGVIYKPGSMQVSEVCLFTYGLYWSSNAYTTKEHLEEWDDIFGEPGWPIDSANYYVIKRTLLLMKRL